MPKSPRNQELFVTQLQRPCGDDHDNSKSNSDDDEQPMDPPETNTMKAPDPAHEQEQEQEQAEAEAPTELQQPLLAGTLTGDSEMAKNAGNEFNTTAKDLLGVSVHHFVHVFLPSVLETKATEKTRFLDLENLKRNATEKNFVRQKTCHSRCPIDGRMGSAYVHTLQGKDHVGPSTAMLSWTWQYTVGDVVATLQDYCREQDCDPKRTVS